MCDNQEIKGKETERYEAYHIFPNVRFITSLNMTNVSCISFSDENRNQELSRAEPAAKETE